ncbi:MAG: 2-phospho-L-lactate guanylyltransferase [Terracidiphilus sp.]|jgi:hypothetical protein
MPQRPFVSSPKSGYDEGKLGGGCKRMKELVFEVIQEADGGYTAEALGESIFTQADSWDELRTNAREAVQAFYFDSDAPASIRLHLIRDEVLAVA